MNLIEQIEDLYQSIPRDLEVTPTDTILHVFKQAREVALTDKYQPEEIRDVLQSPRIKKIQSSLISRCAACEYEIERRFAIECLKAKSLEQAMINYRSYQRYVAMMSQEIESLRALYHKPIQKVLFCGSGPLPISAFILRRELGIEVFTLDYDSQTNDITCEMNQKLPAHLRLKHIHSNYYDFNDFAEFDLVMLAALVGISPDEKKSAMKHLNCNLHQQQLALVRTAEGLRSLFYAQIPEEALEGFKILKKVAATPTTFNASMVLCTTN